MLNLIIKCLCTPERWRPLVLGLIVIFATLLGVIAGKMSLQTDGSLQVTQAPQTPQAPHQEKPSIRIPVQIPIKVTNTATANSMPSQVVSGHSDLFKTILDEHTKALPPAVTALPTQQNSQAMQGHSDLFKNILEKHMKAQLSIAANQPVQ